MVFYSALRGFSCGVFSKIGFHPAIPTISLRSSTSFPCVSCRYCSLPLSEAAEIIIPTNALEGAGNGSTCARSPDIQSGCLPETTYQLARDTGLRFSYLGNVPGARGNTWCPGCGRAVISRNFFTVIAIHLANRVCQVCSTPVPGEWR
jgi:hypothetical protein